MSRRREDREERRRREEKNTLVVDTINGWYLDHVDNPEGKIFNYNDRPVYYMSKIEDNYASIPRPENIDTPPEKLYRALNWPEVLELFKLDTSLMDKLQVGATIALVGIMLFFIFLFLSEKGLI
jgi:hypothetical protein